MTNVYIGLGILLSLVIAVRRLEFFARGKKSLFEYGRKDCIMTPAERECFAALNTGMAMGCHFFPQVHLDSILNPNDSRLRFQAFRHIHQKSVDCVACDKKQLRPLFAIPKLLGAVRR